MRNWPLKKVVLFLILGSFFLTNALVAEFIGVKIFSLEETIGLAKIDISFFGIEHLSFNMTAGVLLWPFVFIMTDLINEYFGSKGVKYLSFLTAALLIYSFSMVWLSMNTNASDFWILKQTSNGTLDMNNAFNAVFGQGLWIISGSLVAFLVGQFLDVYVFHYVKKITGEKYLWIRATGSTIFSQLIDSFLVLFIAFYIGQGWSFSLVMGIGLINYLFKFVVSIIITPLIYLIHYLIESYLGDDLALQMRNEALAKN